MSLKNFKALYHDSPITHLNNAGMSPPHPIIQKVSHDFLNQTLRNGCFGLHEMLQSYYDAVAVFGKIIGCEASEVAMMSTCAVAISQAAFGIELKKDDQILTWDQEYPSNAYPWHVRAQDTGAKVKSVKSNEDFSLDTLKLIEAIGPRTRVIAISWVQYQTGSVTDLKAVVEAARGKNIWVVVDVMQGLGVMPFHMNELGIDIVCGATQKWMCGPVGHGFIAVKKERIAELRPIFYGAITYGTSEDAVDTSRPMRSDARRFEPGAPLLQGTLAAAAVIEELLKLEIPKIHDEAMRLSQSLQREMERRGHRILKNSVAGVAGSPILTLVPKKDALKIEQNLNDLKITYAKRAGGFRFSPHAFNTEADLARVCEAFDRA